MEGGDEGLAAWVVHDLRRWPEVKDPVHGGGTKAALDDGYVVRVFGRPLKASLQRTALGLQRRAV